MFILHHYLNSYLILLGLHIWGPIKFAHLWDIDLEVLSNFPVVVKMANPY